MSDYSELKRLAESATNARWHEDDLGDALEFAPLDGEDQAFILAASPALVFELIAENERLAEDLGKTELRALKFIHQCSAHADLYRELRAERDQLKADNERLRACAESIYRAAWDESGEGLNAEYPGDVHLKPEWDERMKQAIDGIMRQGEKSGG